MTVLQDFSVGDVIECPGRYEMRLVRLEAFAREWDPQPMHLDPVAGAASVFGVQVASGWHTLCATMRLLVDGDILRGLPLIGLGFEHVKFLRAVRAGDVLRARVEILETRASRSRPERGLLRMRVETLDAARVPVASWLPTLTVPARA